jgi:lipopolysaccharide biosynthesis glycosyltransferase
MLNLLKLKKSKEDKLKQSLIDELFKISESIRQNELLFNLADNDYLTEALIYEGKALQLRYNYIIQQAKMQHIGIEYTDRQKGVMS